MEQTQIKILIVEKHSLISMELEEILRSIYSFDIENCHPDRLEEAFKNGAFDLAFIDATNDDAENKTRFDAATRNGADVVFLTSHTHRETAVGALQPLSIIDKPLDDCAVRTTMARWLNTHQFKQ